MGYTWMAIGTCPIRIRCGGEYVQYIGKHAGSIGRKNIWSPDHDHLSWRLEHRRIHGNTGGPIDDEPETYSTRTFLYRSSPGIHHCLDCEEISHRGDIGAR